MKKYILLIITWLVILGINIYRIANDELDIWLWILFVAIAIIPLAEWLKIGEWFDFGSKGIKKKGTRPDSTAIANYSVQNLILNIASTSEVPSIKSIDFDDNVLTEHDKQVIDFIYNADIALNGFSYVIRPIYSSLLVK